jgi:predicted aconitase with swiveling domain
MSQIDASVNGFAIQAVINTAAENTLASDRVVAQLPEKAPMLEQVLELIVKTRSHN